VRINDERDLRERLDQAFETITPHPAPIDVAVRRGLAMRVRRRVAVAVGVAAVIVGVAVFGVPSLHRLASPPPANPANHYTATVLPPGMDALQGLVASGTVNGKSWALALYPSGMFGAGPGQQVIIPAGPAFGRSAPHSSDRVLVTDGTGPVSFTGVSAGPSQVQYGLVRADVSYVTVRLGNGTVLTLHPNLLYSLRAIAFAVPVGAPIISATAYSNHGEIATAIPFNDPGGVATFGAWLKPGQHGLARASERIVSGGLPGYSWPVTAYLGPWGICLKVNGDSCVPITYPAVDTSVTFWGPSTSTNAPKYVIGGTAAAPVVRLVFTVVPPQGARTSIQVRPVTVGGQKLFAFAVPGSPKQLRLSWKAYDSSGAVIASSMAVSPASGVGVSPGQP
jgi:hypothetical protein